MEKKEQQTLAEKFPGLLACIDEEIEELRYLAVVDVNEYDPEIDDDFDEINPEDYNYLVYLPERVVNAIGAELLERLPEIIEEEKIFENFLASEEDLFAVKDEEDREEEVAMKILSTIERELCKAG